VTARLVAPKYALLSGTAALLLGAWSASALASNGFDTQCTEANDALPAPKIPAPSLTIEVTEHGLTIASAHMDAPEAKSGSKSAVSPALADVTKQLSTDDLDEQAGTDESAGTNTQPPGAALRLPGVSDANLPRFRRQMYRIDI
jgi:hypothetical protein